MSTFPLSTAFAASHKVWYVFFLSHTFPKPFPCIPYPEFFVKHTAAALPRLLKFIDIDIDIY